MCHAEVKLCVMLKSNDVSCLSQISISASTLGAIMSESNRSLPPPPTPATGVSQGVKFNLWDFLNSLGNDAKTRRHPSLNQALSGIAGVLIAFGWIALLAGDSDSPAGAYVGAIVAFGIGLVVRLKTSKSTELHAAAVGVGITSLLTFCLVLVIDTQMNAGLGLILTAIAHIAVWVLPGYRGRSIFLAFAALALIFGCSSLIGGEVLTADRCNEFFYDGGDIPDECYQDTIYSDLPGGVGDFLGKQGAVYLILGSALIFGVATLDRRGYNAVGTSLIPAGIVAVLIGSLLMAVRMANAGAGILGAIAGITICYVGSNGQRRALTWWGAATTSIGISGFFIATIKPISSGATASTLIISGLVVGIIPLAIQKAKETRAAQSNP